MNFEGDPFGLHLVAQKILEDLKKESCSCFCAILNYVFKRRSSFEQRMKKAMSEWDRVDTMSKCVKWHRKHTPTLEPHEFYDYYL